MNNEARPSASTTEVIPASAAHRGVHHSARRPMAMGPEPVWMALFDLQRFDTMKRMAGILLRSGFLPRAVNTEEKVLAILIKGYELGLPPMEALVGIGVIEGKPAVSPQLMIALINRSGQLKDLVIEGDDTKCAVTMTRRGRKPHTETFTIDDARRMKSKDGDGNVIALADKYNWRQMPAVMLRWRAVSACARIVFPDVISGVYTPEEMGVDVTVDDEGTMQVVDAEPVPGAPHGDRLHSRPAGTDTKAEPAEAEPATTSATAAPSATVDVDPATGEVREPQAPQSPPASPAAPRAPDAIGAVQDTIVRGPEAAAGEDGAALAHTEPARSSTPGRAAGADDTVEEPEKLTPDDAQELRIMIEKAAAAEGYEGKGGSRKWVATRYGFRNGKLEDVPPALRARMRADALRILTQPGQTNRPSRTPTATPPSANGPATTGNGATTPPNGGAVGAQPATTDQLEEIRRQCTLRGIVHPEHDTGIRQSARRDIDRLEDLTQAQADRVIRYLKYITNEMIPDIAKRLGGTVVEVRARPGGPAA